MTVENPVPPVALENLVRDSLKKIRDTDLKGVVACVDNISDRLTTGEIKLKEIGGYLPWLTNFTLELGGDANENMPRGHILVDTSRTVEGRVFNSDLVRTVLVASQFPDSGYERRLCDVYRTALIRQDEWLRKTGVEFAFLDPRVKWPRDETMLDFHLKQLLGTEAFFLDFGFKDWKSAVADVAMDLQDERLGDWKSQVEKLNEVMESKNAFFRARGRFNKNLFETRDLGPTLSMKIGRMNAGTRAGFASRTAVRQFLSKPPTTY